MLVSRFELTEDLGLTDYQAVQARGHPKEVQEGGLPVMHIEVGRELNGLRATDLREGQDELGAGLSSVVAGRPQLDAIARRDDEGLPTAGDLSSPRGGGDQGLIGQRVLLANRDRRRLVRQPEDQKLHQPTPKLYCATAPKTTSKPAVVKTAARWPRQPAVRRA